MPTARHLFHGLRRGVRDVCRGNPDLCVGLTIFGLLLALLVSFAFIEDKEQKAKDAAEQQIAQKKADAKARGWSWAFTDDAESLAKRLRGELPQRERSLSGERLLEHAVYLADIAAKVHGLSKAKGRIAADAALNLWLGSEGPISALPEQSAVVSELMQVARAVDPVVPWSVEALTAMLWQLNIRQLP